MKIWTAKQLHSFLDGASSDSNYALWLFYILTGVRRGEALALRWSDIDLQAGNVVIRRSLVPVDHRLVIGEPKTNRGRRQISLDTRLVEELRHHRYRQSEERLLMGPAFRDQGLVFAHPDGAPLRPEQVSRWFTALSRQTGVPAIRLHDLRHLHATLALAAGVPTRVVADRLGHSTTAVTADIYQHVLPELDREAANKVAAVVFEQPPEARAAGAEA